jgi:hypothetical protein
MSSEDLRAQLAHILIAEEELTEVPRFDSFMSLLALAVAVGGIMISALVSMTQSRGITTQGESWLIQITFFIAFFLDVSLLIFVPIYARRISSRSTRRRDERQCSVEASDDIIRAWQRDAWKPFQFWTSVYVIAKSRQISMDEAKFKRIESLFATCQIRRRLSLRTAVRVTAYLAVLGLAGAWLRSSPEPKE